MKWRPGLAEVFIHRETKRRLQELCGQHDFKVPPTSPNPDGKGGRPPKIDAFMNELLDVYLASKKAQVQAPKFRESDLRCIKELKRQAARDQKLINVANNPDTLVKTPLVVHGYRTDPKYNYPLRRAVSESLGGVNEGRIKQQVIRLHELGAILSYQKLMDEWVGGLSLVPTTVPLRSYSLLPTLAVES